MTDKKLKSHRVKIDKIDKEIYALIQKRASHAVACLLYTSDAADE